MCIWREICLILCLGQGEVKRINFNSFKYQEKQKSIRKPPSPAQDYHYIRSRPDKNHYSLPQNLGDELSLPHSPEV